MQMKKYRFPMIIKVLSLIIILSGVQSRSFCQVQYSGTLNTGTTASAINFQTQATGVYSFSSGYQSIASGHTSTAFGYKSTAAGIRSFAIGENCYSTDQGYSFGQGAKATVSQSIAIGRFVETNASGAIAFGSSTATSPMVNDKLNSLMVGFNSTQPTLFVGPAASSNGYGNVGIANKDPKQPLHVNGNVLLTGFNSSLLFADDPPTNGAWGKWGIEYDATDPLNTGLNFWKPALGKTPVQAGKSVLTDNYILFLKDNGNVGIGTSSPQAKLHVDGSANITQAFTVGDVKQTASMNVFGPTELTGSLKVSTLQSESASMIVADKDGNLGVAPIPTGGDQMGSHIATLNLQMSGKFITNDDRTSTNEGIFINPSGSVGIKTNNFLNVDDDLTVYDPNPGEGTKTFMRVAAASTNPAIVWTSNGNNSIGLGVSGNKGYLFEKIDSEDVKVITFSGRKVGIGLWPDGATSEIGMSGSHLLFVAGGITAEEVKVKLNTNWPDYVFDESYKLLPLSDIENFIRQNKHLPQVPSQAIVQQEGIDLGAMDAILLKKIEELTLYIIEQDKRIKELELGSQK